MWYSAGTVTVTNGQRLVTGAGTDFVSNVFAGGGFIGPDGRVYEIEQVISATQIMLRTNYYGGTAGAQGYTIIPTQSLMKDLADAASQLIASFASVRDGIGAGLMKPGSAAAPGLRFENDQDTGIFWGGGNVLGLATGGVVQVLVDGTGRVVLSASSAAERLNVGGRVYAIANGEVGYRLYNSGGGAEWFMGQRSATEHDLAFQTWVGSTKTDLLVLGASGDLYSGKDNNSNALGLPSKRWSTVYAGTGTINTSDEREKLWRSGLSDAEKAAARRIIGELGFFQWADSVTDKGGDGARMHFGVRAQAVARILIEEGVEDQQPIDLDSGIFLPEGQRPSFKTGFLCFDTWEDQFAPEYQEVDVPHQVPSGLFDHNGAEVMKTVTTPELRATGGTMKVQAAGNRFGLRIDQLALFIAAALAADLVEADAEISTLSAQIAVLASRLDALEAA